MACVTAHALRDGAREAVFHAGGRGFVRFLPEGKALLVTDAVRRMPNEEAVQRLIQAVIEAGFFCDEQDGLLLMTPKDEWIQADASPRPVDWQDPLHPIRALAVRLLMEPKRPLDDAGRSLILETLRLTWQAQERVMQGQEDLRARVAVMLRQNRRSGLHEAGAILQNWCDEQEAEK